VAFHVTLPQVQGTGKARAGATLVIGGMMFACSESLEEGWFAYSWPDHCW
jgi:hypothetical protein